MTPDLSTCTSFPEILAALHASSYTGPITFHFASGQPKRADLPAPSPPTISVPIGPARPRPRKLPAVGA